MIGFTGKVNLISQEIENDKEIITSSLFKNQNIEISRSSNGKFLNDKLFFKKGDVLFLLEGVITNSSELIQKYKTESWLDAFYCSYCKNKETFFKEFRGSFCGLVYDISLNKVTLFVDHLRTKDVFYSISDNVFSFSTDIRELVKSENKKYKLDVDAAYLLLTFGATLEERTLFSSIKKLPYGSYLSCDYRTFDIQSYYEIKIDYSNSNNVSYFEHIDRIDQLFRKAIDRQFSKDREYGYDHLVGLSAGRDSRMTTWVSHEMGYKENVLNFSFSESNQLDETIPKAIAKDLKNDWLFKSLDNGNCLNFFEEVNESLCGELSLQNVLHSYSFMKNFNFDKYGIMHSGQVGDGIINYYGGNTLSKDLRTVPYIQSKKLIDRVIEKSIVSLEGFQSDEEFVHVNRGIGVTLGSAQFLYKYSETVSPFTDIDLMEYCFSVPYDIRKGIKLYDDWMIKKYPNSTKYSHNGRKIGVNPIVLFGREFTLQELPSKVKRFVINRTKKKGSDNSGMNPMNYWYYNNLQLRSKLDCFFKDNISRINNNELYKDVELLYNEGTVGDKMQVITLLTTLKQYF